MTPLQITPHYTQVPPTDNTTLASYAIAATLAFTLLVYLFESYLDLRQRSSYFQTTFPKELESTVSSIDAEIKPNGTDASNTEKEEDEVTGEETKKQVDKSQPLLPQLQSKFSSAQSYGLDKITFSIVSSAYSLLEEIVYLLYGFYPYTWDKACQFGQRWGWNEAENEIKITLLFLGILTVVGTITSTPFELYSTFRIEKKHGFNKQTVGLFFSDKVKGLALTAVIGGPFVALLLKIIQWGGPNFYIYVWAFMFVFSVIMMTIYPVLIMPLFNKYEPLPEGELKRQIYELAGRLAFPLTKLFVMDGSKRSSHSNAFMFGFFKNKR
jgi:STE24 endopeptidase